MLSLEVFHAKLEDKRPCEDLLFRAHLSWVREKEKEKVGRGEEDTALVLVYQPRRRLQTSATTGDTGAVSEQDETAEKDGEGRRGGKKKEKREGGGEGRGKSWLRSVLCKEN